MPEPHTILPANASQLEQNIDRGLHDRFEPLSAALTRVWSVADCPPVLLPHLAAAVSVDLWRDEWPDTVKRQVIAASYNVHRFKGTPTAMREALAAIGIEADLTEWFERPSQMRPHTFSLTARIGPNQAAGQYFSKDLIALIRQMITAVKPVRSHYDLRLEAPVRLGLGLAARASVAGLVCRTVSFKNGVPA